MKKVLIVLIIGLVVLVGCSNGVNNAPEPVTARAIFELNRVYVDGVAVTDVNETPYAYANLAFFGAEAGGTVIINVAGETITAGINPSREHPSFESGEWHHHLYAGSTATGSTRINFHELLPQVAIDNNSEATDNTQSSYQHGNLHYLVATGEYRLRFLVGGVFHELIFTLVD